MERRNGGKARNIPWICVGTKLPRRILCPPWTEEKMDLLDRLVEWGLRAHWSRERRFYPGLTEAIDSGNLRVISQYVYHSVRAFVDQELVLHALEKNADERIIISLLEAYDATAPPIVRVTRTKIYRTALRIQADLLNDPQSRLRKSSHLERQKHQVEMLKWDTVLRWLQMQLTGLRTRPGLPRRSRRRRR